MKERPRISFTSLTVSCFVYVENREIPKKNRKKMAVTMHGRLCRRKPTLKANARRHSVHAHVSGHCKQQGTKTEKFNLTLKN